VDPDLIDDGFCMVCDAIDDPATLSGFSEMAAVVPVSLSGFGACGAIVLYQTLMLIVVDPLVYVGFI
jgi:hypothetical protein